MTLLRYFMPLIIEGNKRNLLSTVFIGSNAKYSSPHKYIDVIKNMSEQFNFKIDKLRANVSLADVTFFVEGSGIENIKGNGSKVVLTSLRDFSVLYKNYIELSTYVIMQSKFLADHYGTLSEKNMYLGSPKYDVILNKDKISIKYGLSNKNALCLFPKLKHMDSRKYEQLLTIYSYLKKMGYNIVVKTRGKDLVPKKYRGDKYFEDYSWYPHSTMELMSISDIILNFDSTSIKESIMLNRPVINFSIKPMKLFSFLYDDKYAPNLDMGVNYELFEQTLERLTSVDLSNDFYNAREKYLFQPSEISNKILNLVL